MHFEDYLSPYILPERARELIPKWLCDPDIFTITANGLLPQREIGANKFWFEYDGELLHLKTPDNGVDNSGLVIFPNMDGPIGSKAQIEIPFDELRCNDPLGPYTLYYHAFHTDVPVAYIGVTKNGWGSRLAQHLSLARGGHGYALHEAIRRHADAPVHHRVLLHNISYEMAMALEEEFVEYTLYPKGLNMIPGGFAGLSYLSKLGFSVKNEKQRDRAIITLLKMERVKGKPNPLCAARWRSDQDFINRVICGHSGRLTPEQVAQIRLMFSYGRDVESISSLLSIKNVRQIRDVATGKRYGRVR